MPPFSIGCRVNSSVRPLSMSTSNAESSLPESRASSRSIRLVALASLSWPAAATLSTSRRMLKPFSSKSGASPSC